MAVRPVIRMGDARLYADNSLVTEFNSPELDALVTDLIDTMQACQGAGLAAPQIAINQQVVIFGFEHNDRYPDATEVPFTVLINPVIEPLTDVMVESWEGCLSIPGMRGLVPRFEKIRYQGFDAKGNKIDRTVEGFHAIVVQHECDHLQGILYPFHIKDLHNFGFEHEITENLLSLKQGTENNKPLTEE